MSTRHSFRRIGLSLALGVATLVSTVAAAVPASAAVKTPLPVPPASLDTATAVRAQGPIQISTTCILNPGTAARDGTQVATTGSVTCNGPVRLIEMAVALYYNGSLDSYQFFSSGPAISLSGRHAAPCRNGTWQSYAIARVTFLSGTPLVITADAYGPAVNITC